MNMPDMAKRVVDANVLLYFQGKVKSKVSVENGIQKDSQATFLKVERILDDSGS